MGYSGLQGVIVGYKRVIVGCKSTVKQFVINVTEMQLEGTRTKTLLRVQGQRHYLVWESTFGEEWSAVVTVAILQVQVSFLN